MILQCCKGATGDSDQKPHRASARMMTKAVTGIGNVSEVLGQPRVVLLPCEVKFAGVVGIALHVYFN